MRLINRLICALLMGLVSLAGACSSSSTSHKDAQSDGRNQDAVVDRFDLGVIDAPATDSKVDAPAVDAPTVDAPTVDAPAADAPSTDTLPDEIEAPTAGDI